MMVPFVNGWTSLVESSRDRRAGCVSGRGSQGPHDRQVFEMSVRNTLGISCMFMWIILAALGFGAVFDGLGAVKAIDALFTEQLGLEPWMILILMQLSFILMGTFLDDTAMLVIVAPLYVPLVGELGFDLVWYGVLYTITTQIAYMTPPFGYNLFLMRAMAPPEIGLTDIYKLHHPVCRCDDTGVDPGHGVPADRTVAAELCIWEVRLNSTEPGSIPKEVIFDTFDRFFRVCWLGVLRAVVWLTTSGAQRRPAGPKNRPSVGQIRPSDALWRLPDAPASRFAPRLPE